MTAASRVDPPGYAVCAAGFDLLETFFDSVKIV
jgi:hypothetical protein